ncbi:hypothetical protein [Sulfuriferula plumbiphila]|nr:hypothetical protein [Sulfuriferula plumbiphila]
MQSNWGIGIEQEARGWKRPPAQMKSAESDAIKFAWELPAPRQRYFEIHIRRSTLIAVIASLLVHALLLFTLNQKQMRIGSPSVQDTQAPLVVQLTPLMPARVTPKHAKRVPIHPTKNPKIRPRPPVKQQTSKPRLKPRVPVSPRPHAPPAAVVATTKPSLNTSVMPAAPVVDTTPTASPAPPTDMMSYINAVRARRQAAEQADAEPGANQRNPTPDEIRMANIKRNLQPGGTNGVFQILSMGVRTAQFSFRGWTTDSSHFQHQVIDVDAGLNGDVERAIVRRMIELIRQYYKGDFNWESQRLNRVIVLSARKEDNAQLEDFLMKEFFRRDGELRE